jgi:uncharacterized protein Usg
MKKKQIERKITLFIMGNGIEEATIKSYLEDQIKVYQGKIYSDRAILKDLPESASYSQVKRVTDRLSGSLRVLSYFQKRLKNL